MADEVKASERYETLASDRNTYTDMAVNCAEYTLPYIMREDGANSSDNYPNNYVRGFGSQLVNNLAGKLANGIMPPNQPFFRLVAEEDAKEAISNGDKDIDSELDKEIAVYDEKVFRHILKSGFKDKLFEFCLHLLITGNGLVEKVNGKFRFFSLRNYVVKRDSNGDVIELIIEEKLSKESLPEDIVAKGNEENENMLYTKCVKVDGKFEVTQELNEEIVGQTYTYENIWDRFIVGVWTLASGEDYGRGHVELHYDTLDDMNEHMTIVSKTSKVASKIVHTVKPNGFTSYKDYVKATNGKAIIGNADDIGVITAGGEINLTSSISMIEQYRNELSEAFLYVKGAIRQSERTTKFEIQVLINELEGGLGGNYSPIANLIQRPQVEWAIKDLGIKLEKDVTIDIISGSDALGKSIESLKIQTLMEDLGSLGVIVGQEAIADEINLTNVVSSIVANSGVASKNLVRTKAEKDALVKSRQEAELIKQFANPALNSAGNGVGDMLSPQQQ